MSTKTITFVPSPLSFHFHTPLETTVNPAGWRVIGRWLGKRKCYTAQVIAERDNSKKHLAYLITGDEKDSGLLGVQEQVKIGQHISVAPLLVKLENSLREKVVSLCERINTSFPQNAAQVAEATNVVVDSSKGSSGEINNYFTSDREKPYGFLDCNRAAFYILAKSVIDVIGGQLFDKLGYQATNFPSYEIRLKQASQMLNGDWGYFANYDDYNDKMATLKIPLPPFQGENVFKREKDAYYGLPGEGDNTERGWLERLREEYNKPQELPNEVRKAKGKQRNELPPGFNGYVRFVDVAVLATAVFRYRSRIKG